MRTLSSASDCTMLRLRVQPLIQFLALSDVRGLFGWREIDSDQIFVNPQPALLDLCPCRRRRCTKSPSN